MAARSSSTTRRHRAQLAKAKPPCALCGQPIDYTLAFIVGQHGTKCRKPDCTGCVPDPMRFEADHIIPLMRGGEDVLSNKQATHRKCNSTKRGRSESPIVKTSGSLR